MQNIAEFSIKEIVQGKNARFLRYRHQHLYFVVEYRNEGYSFPVPLVDVQDASVHSVEKAITLMRYIRKAIDAGTFIKANIDE